MLNLYRNNFNRGGFIDNYSVYMHINKYNDKIYVGITKQKPENRWGLNGIKYKNKCPHFWNAIQKYGWDSFDHFVFATSISKESACEIEKTLIRLYNTQDRKHGYNTLEGGMAPTLTEEVRAKMSASMKGNKNGLGKPCSVEKARKISIAQKGKELTEEHRKNISSAKKGKTHKPLSEESRKKIADNHEKKQVYCHELDKVFESIQQCARELNIDPTRICAICKGKRKTCKGYHFEYYNDTIKA